ncbi:hypothetical protein niasHT_026681 [Heterodera trifolii]|uniref:Sphingomyelin synthase-like domain-containing protein n=1 Tax=Heterodera trifolii TaxID=157864 RepID=A0ABD2JSV1_9BILA
MGGHRREVSDSHMPLRQSEVQAGTMEMHQELQIRVDSPGNAGGMAPPPMTNSSNSGGSSSGCCNGNIGTGGGVGTSADSAQLQHNYGHNYHHNHQNNNNYINCTQQNKRHQKPNHQTGLMKMTAVDNVSNRRSRATSTGDEDELTMSGYGGRAANNKKKGLGNSSRQSQFFRSELMKTVVAFLCLAVSAFLNFLLLTIIHDIVPRQPLDDLVWFIIPQQGWAWPVGDVLSTVNSVVGFCIVILHRHRMVIFRRVFLIAAILYGLRAIVLGVTFLPPAFENRDKLCRPQMNGTSMYVDEIAARFVTYVVTLGLTSGQPEILCGDLMFSGHTVVLSIMYFTQLRYSPRGLYILRWIALPITFMGIAALVLSGGHYTMDVLIAYWLTSHVFWSYHQQFEMPTAQRTQSALSNIWWFWLCFWFESEVPDTGPIVNDWNWPFAQPHFMHTLMAKLNAKLQ